MSDRESVRDYSDSIALRDNQVSAKELMEWIAIELTNLPPDCRDTAHLWACVSGGYGNESTYCDELTMCYLRPETDEEMQKRIAQHKEREKYEEARDREMLRRLQAKYAKPEGS